MSKPDTRVAKVDGKEITLFEKSHYDAEIDHSPGRLAGNSRKAGDASLEVKGAVVDLLRETAAKHKLTTRETAILISMAYLESKFNPDAAAPNSSATGIGQFIDKTGSSFKLNDNKDRFDAAKNIDALTKHFLENKKLSLGKTEDYIYRYHHDGPGKDHGGLELSRRKVMPLVDEIEKGIKSGKPAVEIVTAIESNNAKINAAFVVNKKHPDSPEKKAIREKIEDAEYGKVEVVDGQNLNPRGGHAKATPKHEPSSLGNIKDAVNKFASQVKSAEQKLVKEMSATIAPLGGITGPLKEVESKIAKKVTGLVKDVGHAVDSLGSAIKGPDHEHAHSHVTSAKASKGAKVSAEAIASIPEIKFVATTELTVKDAHKGKLDGQAFGGGKTEQGVIDLARAVQGTLGDKLERFTGFNDAYHAKHATSSKHAQGLAMDFTLKHAKDNKVVSAQIQQIGRDFGIELFVNNEYIKDSKHKTAPHIHVGFRSSKDAQKFAEIAAMPADEREALLAANRAKQEQALQAKQAKAHDAPLAGAAHIERETPKPPTKPEPKADAKPEPKPDAQPAPRSGGM